MNAPGLGAAADRVTVRFGSTLALDNLTVAIPAGRITGVFGRNGAGKSTLFRFLAGYSTPTSGRVAVGDADPFEDAGRMAGTCLVRENILFAGSTSVRDHFRIAAVGRPNWDQPYAERLIDRFEIPIKKKIGKLSRGKQAAVAVITGLASRAPLTMFDEPHLGMDAPSRYAFYDELLADYSASPRTILLSTHVIDEVANLIEDAVIVDRGRLVVHDGVDSLRSRGAQVTGPAEDVDDVTFGLTILSSRTLGRTKQAVVYDQLNGDFARRAAAAGIDVGPVPLQDLFVHLTTPNESKPDESMPSEAARP